MFVHRCRRRSAHRLVLAVDITSILRRYYVDIYVDYTPVYYYYYYVDITSIVLPFIIIMITSI